MCMMSVVTQRHQQLWEPIRPGSWDLKPATTVTPTPCSWDEYWELKRKAAEYDRITGQPDCHDPKKQEFEAAVMQLLRDKYGIEPRSEVTPDADFAARVRKNPEAALQEIMASLSGGVEG